MGMSARDVQRDGDAEDLLGAYALDACDEQDTAAVEAVLAAREDLADEAARLIEAAGWIGATEALTAPPRLRAAVLNAARARRDLGPLDGPARAYTASTGR